MDLSTLFALYYTQYRGEATAPATTDPEYAIFIAYATEAIFRWASYDNTYWKELYTSLQASTQVSPALVKTLTTGTKTYTAPADMKEVGGYVRVLDASNNTVRRYPIIEPQEAQFKTDASYFCYFTGNPQTGFTMHLNPAPDSAVNGLNFDYVYYKLPTTWTTASLGTATTEMSEPMFIVHRALASRFRSTRNPYYQSAKNDGEDVLKIMQMANNSGSFAAPWRVQDNSGTTFGQENIGW